MRKQDYFFPGVFAPVLSLDQLYEKGREDGSGFDLVDNEPTPDQIFENGQTITAIREFVDNLPPRDRLIVRAVFWEDRTQTDVASELHVSKMAISKAVARICARGRVALTPHQFLALAA